MPLPAKVPTLVLGYEVPHAHIQLIPTTSEAQVLAPKRHPTDHPALAALAAKAKRESIYLDQRFSDHAPLIIDYDFKL